MHSMCSYLFISMESRDKKKWDACSIKLLLPRIYTNIQFPKKQTPKLQAAMASSYRHTIWRLSKLSPSPFKRFMLSTSTLLMYKCYTVTTRSKWSEDIMSSSSLVNSILSFTSRSWCCFHLHYFPLILNRRKTFWNSASTESINVWIVTFCVCFSRL